MDVSPDMKHACMVPRPQPVPEQRRPADWPMSGDRTSTFPGGENRGQVQGAGPPLKTATCEFESQDAPLSGLLLPPLCLSRSLLTETSVMGSFLNDRNTSFNLGGKWVKAMILI